MGPMYPSSPNGELIYKYKNVMKNIIDKLGLPLKEFEINEGIEYAINTTFKNCSVEVHNNYTDKTAIMDLLSLSNELLVKKPIMTTKGVLFKRHGTVKNPFYNLIQFFCDMRDKAKEEMKKYPKGSEEYNKYNMLQSNYKVSCNAIYGCAANNTSIFYNFYTASAITGQGRGCITASIMMFESLLANNIKFGSLTEICTFIDNTISDLKLSINNKFIDKNVLDRDISIEETFLKLMRNCGENSYVPSDRDAEVIWRILNNCNQRVINVLYYKSNLYKFYENKRIKNLILKILEDLNEPFLNPNKVPEEIKDNLSMFYDLVYEYVYYRHIYIDKLGRVNNMVRDVVLITDTDSCIVSFNNWYKCCLKDTVGVPLKIKYTKTQIEEHADRIILDFQKTEPTEEYDFYNDKLVDIKRKKYPVVIIEEDGLRFSIINIISNVTGKLILDYMELFSENYNTKTEGRKCLLIMKNEFLFKTILLSIGKKKNYADLQLVQEGNIIPYDKQLDIKGMPFTKAGTSESTAKELSDILEFDILRASIIDQIDIVRKIATLEKKIYRSLKNKEMKYYKPVRMKAMSSYKEPMSEQPIKASYAYNYVLLPGEIAINLDDLNSVFIIKVDITNKNIDKMMESDPERYLKFKKLLEMKEYKNKITSIALPYDQQLPDWIIPFIDYTTIIQDNVKTFPLESIGITRDNQNNTTYTNIVKVG